MNLAPVSIKWFQLLFMSSSFKYTWYTMYYWSRLYFCKKLIFSTGGLSLHLGKKCRQIRFTGRCWVQGWVSIYFSQKSILQECWSFSTVVLKLNFRSLYEIYNVLRIIRLVLTRNQRLAFQLQIFKNFCERGCRTKYLFLQWKRLNVIMFNVISCSLVSHLKINIFK